MDRYKFEDSISAYIDNELTLTERQEFEDYIEKNPYACLLYTSPSPRD